MNRGTADEVLQQLAQVCRGLDRRRQHVPSGLTALDAALPGGGWPSASIVELLPACHGIGELRLLLPALTHITRSERHVALIAPPYIPFAPALLQHGLKLTQLWVIATTSATDALWSAEQLLRCKSFGMVVAWPTQVHDRAVRRLQLAAEAGDSTGFIYRPPSAARDASPAAIRLQLQAHEGTLRIKVLKCRGGRSGALITTPIGTGSLQSGDTSMTAPASSIPAAIAGCAE